MYRIVAYSIIVAGSIYIYGGLIDADDNSDEISDVSVYTISKQFITH